MRQSPWTIASRSIIIEQIQQQRFPPNINSLEPRCTQTTSSPHTTTIQQNAMTSNKQHKHTVPSMKIDR